MMQREAFEFFEDVDGLSTTTAIMAEMGAALQRCGIDHFVLSFVPTATENLADVMLFDRLPPGYVQAYTERQFTADDPAFRYSQLTSFPFRWLKDAPHDPANDARVAELVQFNRDFALVDGVVVPVASPIVGRLGQVWFGGAEIDLPDRALPFLHLMSLTAFNRVLKINGAPSTVTTLTAREREALTRAALGETAEQIGKALNVSTPTATMHLKHCREKLGATNITQAVAIALGHRMLRP
ncbi:helix-turn-helix transcriptional regulator [Bradyrhizobium japonicum]|uniref:helix-turn-helix transcriptional regulator n=1 Tax=Bradyrhizobium japonicum TaxID=375 RepID=UPI001E2C5FDA|nr:LuxR family transcriptional regulator [Bradyrhizobium japonicum]MCD9821222.1 LuxR family transcriptional regulator [Bradyrhizobium japonicum]MEB2674082.1 LuxR family transcriptional regulator [Bradyrhizobium japonicum]WRI93268.1 LuxR family transcriptional regulator [Bradyrhizobium japonicum]